MAENCNDCNRPDYIGTFPNCVSDKCTLADCSGNARNWTGTKTLGCVCTCRGNWTGPEAHMIRALADRLEEHIDALADYDALNAELMEANQRADSWREEAQAIQRQLDQVRG